MTSECDGRASSAAVRAHPHKIEYATDVDLERVPPRARILLQLSSAKGRGGGNTGHQFHINRVNTKIKPSSLRLPRTDIDPAFAISTSSFPKAPKHLLPGSFRACYLPHVRGERQHLSARCGGGDRVLCPLEGRLSLLMQARPLRGRIVLRSLARSRVTHQ
jgi:hypothetical protein